MKIMSWLNISIIHLREILTVIKEVRDILYGVDKWYVRFKYLGSVTSALQTFLSFWLVGLSLQFLYEWVFAASGTNPDLVRLAAVVMVVYLAGMGAFGAWANYRTQRFINNLDDVIEDRIITQMASLDMARLIDPSFLELKDSAEHKGSGSIEDIFDIIQNSLTHLVVVFVSVGVVWQVRPILVLLLLLPIIPKLVRSMTIKKRTRQLWESQHIIRRKKRVYAHCLNDAPRLIMMRLLQFGNFIRKQYRSLQFQLRDEQNALSRYERNSNLVLLIPSHAVGLIVILVLAQQVIAGTIDLPKLFLIFAAITRFPDSIFRLLNTGVELRHATLDYQYLRDFLNTKPVIDESGAVDINLTSCPNFTIQNVSFRYPRQESFAIQRCSVRIDSGEKIAIIGQNGSGKTTLARMIAKIYIPSEGSVFVADQSIEHITQRSWLTHLLYLGQQFKILDLRADFAIAGKSIDELDIDRFEKARAIAGTDEFMLALKNGYSTQIGEQWQNGVGFSGGQIQRLSLAAALYRLFDEEVCVGIFDEPMSECDISTRDRFYKAITHQTKEKTIIVIAHDPLFLHYFERLIVMDQGRIVQDLWGQALLQYQQELIQQQPAFQL